jgi:Fe-S-cluster formation regulator IscX/YfhJ
MKKKLPFTAGEWDAVRWAAGAVTEAAQADDADRRAARFTDLRSILAELRGRYGDHPLLWETEADFAPDPLAAAEMYRHAEAAAVEAEWPTMSIRLALARVLAEELDQRADAREVLLACRDELPWSLEADCLAWANLLSECPPDVPAALVGTRPGAARPVALRGAD